MPFKNIRVSQPQRNFQEIDEIILANVFPELHWHYFGNRAKYVRILPNLRPTRSPDDVGPTRSKNPKEYFVLGCLKVGLPYSEIGRWLDYCLDTHIVEHTDGITRQINAESERLLRLDERKPIYHFEGTYRSLLIVRILEQSACPSPTPLK